MALQKIEIKDLCFNPFEKLDSQWALLGAGGPGKFNMMTVSWGGVGVLWSKPVVTVYVRENRYTKEFMDANDTFVLSFLKDGYRDVLGVLGSRSGRDMDKMGASGLTPAAVEGGITFEETELAFVCRKLYVGDMPKENFLYEETLRTHYPDGNYHTMYVGEILAAYKD